MTELWQDGSVVLSHFFEITIFVLNRQAMAIKTDLPQSAKDRKA